MSYVLQALKDGSATSFNMHPFAESQSFCHSKSITIPLQLLLLQLAWKTLLSSEHHGNLTHHHTCILWRASLWYSCCLPSHMGSPWSAETFVASTFEEGNDAYALWTVLFTSTQTVRPWTRCAHMLQLVNCRCFHTSSLNCTAASFLATNPPPKLEVQHAKLLHLHHTAFYHNAAIISTDIVHVGQVFTTTSSNLLLLHVHSLLYLLTLHPLWQIKSH